MNLLTGSVTSGGSVSIAGGSLPAATGSVPVGAEVTVGVRPEYLTLSIGDVSGPSIRGSVVVAENLGTQSLVSVECDGTLIGVTVPEEDEAGSGCDCSADRFRVPGAPLRQRVGRTAGSAACPGRSMMC